LECDEREAVLGDALESGDGTWQTLSSVFGLVLRRQLLLWKSWRPWLAVFVLGLPGAYLLMIVSISVTCTYDRLMGLPMGHWAPTGHEGVAMLLCHICLLIAWSWASGFTLGSLSPKTLWLNAVLFVLLGFDKGNHFQLGSFFRLCPFLFLVPALWGIHQGMRTVRLRFTPAFLLAATITVLMIAAWTDNALWVFNWLLIGPAWFLVAMARRSSSKPLMPAKRSQAQQ